MFESIFSNGYKLSAILIGTLVAIILGLIDSFIVSRKINSTKGYYLTVALILPIVSITIMLLSYFLSGTSSEISRLTTIAIALGLIRFRSNNGRAEEILFLLLSITSGLTIGLGYVGYTVLINLVLCLLFVIFYSLPLFNIEKNEYLLKITIPESLNFVDVFDDLFNKYLKSYKTVEIKTTGLGSMYKLSYKVSLNNINEQKELMDEIRMRNGNLDICIMPFVENSNSL